MPIWFQPWMAKLAAIGAAILAGMIFVARVFGAGKKAQRNEDAKVTGDVLDKQRDVAANPVAADVARQRLRDGKL